MTPQEKVSVVDHAKKYGIEINSNSLKKSRKKTYNKWFETQDSIDYWEDFNRQKIVFTKASKKQAFAFVDAPIFLLQTAYLATGTNLKVILTILNSKLVEFSFNKFYQGGGIDGEITRQAIMNVPIPEITNSFSNRLGKLLDKMSRIKEKCGKTEQLEHYIDLSIYSLYGLNESEIETIDSQ